MRVRGKDRSDALDKFGGLRHGDAILHQRQPDGALSRLRAIKQGDGDVFGLTGAQNGRGYRQVAVQPSGIDDGVGIAIARNGWGEQGEIGRDSNQDGDTDKNQGCCNFSFHGASSSGGRIRTNRLRPLTGIGCKQRGGVGRTHFNLSLRPRT